MTTLEIVLEFYCAECGLPMVVERRWPEWWQVAVTPCPHPVVLPVEEKKP